MDLHAWAVLILAVSAFVLMGHGRVSMQLVSVGVLAALALLFQVFPYTNDGIVYKGSDFYFGFGHEAVIAIACLMLHGHALVVTGALEPVARLLARVSTWNQHFSILIVLVISMLMSMVMNDTPVVVIMIPILVSAALQSRGSVAKTLMPMNFAVLLGGMATTIGTSTNLLVVSIAQDLGGPRFAMFDFTHIALFAAVPALIYLWLVAPRLLSDRETRMPSTTPRLYSAILKVEEGGRADGMELRALMERGGDRLRVEHVERGDGIFLIRFPTLALRAGDKLSVRDTPENLKELEKELGLSLSRDAREDDEGAGRGEQLIEIVVSAGSLLEGRTLADARFGERFGMIALAVHRPRTNAPLAKDIANLTLWQGDVLLMQGSVDNVATVKGANVGLVLDGRVDIPHTAKAPVAVATLFGVIVLAATGLLPIYVGALMGVAVLLFSRTLDLSHLARALKSDVILLLAASLAIGKGFTITGLATSGASIVAEYGLEAEPVYTVMALMAATAVMTNFVSNTAAAAIMTPLSLQIGAQLGMAVEPFVLAVLFGCNLSYATPFAYQTNLLVMGAAGYRFADFMKVGIPLAVMLVLVLSWALARAYFS